MSARTLGWTGPAEGYHIEDYFRGGRYLGPDEDGVEPTIDGIPLSAAPELLAAQQHRA